MSVSTNDPAPQKATKRKHFGQKKTSRTLEFADHNEETFQLKGPKQPKKGNDFGADTFWNLPGKARRPSNVEALAAAREPPTPDDLIVDTGASHVLFQKKHMSLLTNIQMSNPHCKPFAVLRAANRQVLQAVGRGMFTIKSISVVAYIFGDEDLVHNLSGIAPFADCGCKAVFTGHDFNLYHNGILLVTGKRHSANLWHIALQRPTGKSTPVTSSLA